MKSGKVVLILTLLIILAGGALFLRLRQEPPRPVAAPQSRPQSVHPAPVPAAEHPARSSRLPVPPRHQIPPLPQAEVPSPTKIEAPPFPVTLEATDNYLSQRLPQLQQGNDLSLLAIDQFVAKIVLLIDRLPSHSIPRLHLPFTPPAPGFKTSEQKERRIISSENADRYLPYVEMLENSSDEVLVQLYRNLYPFFQQAYRELGHPNGYFNDRLIEVIDHLLATPEIKEPVVVEKVAHTYRFIDPLLESRSAGQKVLLRVGSSNRQRIKRKLRSLQQALLNLSKSNDQ